MNPAPLDSVTLVVPAFTGGQPGVKKYTLGGNLLLITSATFPFKMQFDAGSPFDCRAGYKFGPDASGFETLTFFNSQLTPLTITFDRGALGVDYVGTDEVKDSSTFSVGNLGQPGAAGIAVPAATIVNGLITNVAAAIKVPGTYQGHQRKSIIFSLPTNNWSLIILDANGNYFANLNASLSNSTVELETNASFLLLAVGAQINVNIGELYYSN